MLRPADSALRMRGRWLLFAPGCFALLSVLWSAAPMQSFRLGLELIFTIYMGLWLAGSSRPGDVVAGLAMAGMLYLLPSLALGQSVAIGNAPGEKAFSGLNSGKNLFGDIAAIGILSMVCLQLKTWMKQPLMTALLLLALAGEIYAIVLSQSAGAMVAAFGGCAVMIYLVLLSRAGPTIRAWMLMVSALSAIMALVLYLVVGDEISQWMMAFFHKDLTMTGRLYLWARSKEIIAGHAMLGVGYSAFWVPGNLDAEGLLTWSRIPSRMGFNFHNAIIANLVELGYVGLAVLGVTVGAATVALVSQALRWGQTVTAFWVAILFYELSRIPIEALGPLPFYHTTVLLWVAMGMVWSARPNTPMPQDRYA